jgi:hypothetical protein
MFSSANLNQTTPRLAMERAMAPIVRGKFAKKDSTRANKKNIIAPKLSRDDLCDFLPECRCATCLVRSLSDQVCGTPLTSCGEVDEYEDEADESSEVRRRLLMIARLFFFFLLAFLASSSYNERQKEVGI